MDVAASQMTTWWTAAMIVGVGILLSICVVVKLHEHDIYPLRDATRIVRRPWFEAVLLLFCIGGLIQYGATKGTNGTDGVNRPLLTQHPDLQTGNLGADNGGRNGLFPITNLCFTGIVPMSNSVCLSFAWPTNMFVDGTTLDVFAKINALTNDWTWIAAVDTLPFATNCEMEVGCPAGSGTFGVPTAMFFLVQDRSTCALTMNDADLDGIPDVYERYNGTNPYVPDAGSVPRLTVGQNGAYASVEAALADSVAYSVISLERETFALPKSLVMPSHPVLIEGPATGYAVLQSVAVIGAVMLTDGQSEQTMFRNLIVDLRARRSFQAGFWIGGNTPWTGRGAAATFENVRVRANYPGVENFGWLFYGNAGGPSYLRKCLMNAAGSTWAYGVSAYNAASNVIEDCAFLNMPTNAGESTAIAVLTRESGRGVIGLESPENRPDLSWAGYPYDGTYSQSADSDGDGISDADEIFRTNTDPWLADSDGDGIRDGEEADDETDPRNFNSHGYRLVVSVRNADVIPNVTNYVFIASGDNQWGDLVYRCHEEGGSTNFAWRINEGALLVSSFRDLNRNGTLDPDYDIVVSNMVSGFQAVADLTFSFGDIDGDGVNDLQERADETDPYQKTSLRILRTVQITNTDTSLAADNYYAIAQTKNVAAVQWVRMMSDQVTVPVSQNTSSGCLYALVFRDLNGNGVYDETVDVLYGEKRFVSSSSPFSVSIGDADGDTISDSCEMREGTDPLNPKSYCYLSSARIVDVFATTNRLTCNAMFGTNEILSATVVTNSELAVSFGHQSTVNGEFVTLWFWDDANSNSVREAGETCTSIAIRPKGHEVAYEGTLSTAAFDKDRNGLMDWWETQTGLSVLDESHRETDDNDHDGLINLHEYWAGTDPLTPDGSNTALCVLAQSIDERLTRAQTTNDVLDVYVDYYQNGTNGVFVRNQNCWMYDLDLSCLSVWNSSGDPHGHGGTAITKKHILWAKHWYLGSGSRLDFVGTNGVVYSRIVDKVRFISVPGVSENDISVASLTEELPDSVIPARILDQNAREKIISGKYLPVVTINQDKRALVQEVSNIAFGGDRSCTVTYQQPKDALRVAFSGNIRGGDSGSPTFFIYNGKLILVGTHWRVGVDSSFPMALEAIRSAVNALASGYEIETEDFGTNEIGGAASE